MRALRRRSDAAFARVGGRDAVITGLNYVLIVNPMGRSCPPNAWRISRAAMIDRNGVCAQSTFQNRHDLAAGTASGCMRWLGGIPTEARDHLPAMLARAGVPRDGVRGRFSCALTGVMAVGCPSP